MRFETVICEKQELTNYAMLKLETVLGEFLRYCINNTYQDCRIPHTWELER